MSLRTPTLDPSIMDEIAALGGNLSKVARVMGLDYHALKMRSATISMGFSPRVVLEEPEDLFDLARPDIRRYAIAVKRDTGPWRNEFKKAIEDARVKYDAGTHEMVQGRNKGWVVLYLIPRLLPTKTRTYFSTMEVME